MPDRKTEILQTAAAILREKSFSAFSYADLEQALGIRKASIHHHFATKEKLALALLDYYACNARKAMQGLVDAHATPGAILSAFLDGAEAMMLGEGRVCPHSVFAIDGDQLPASVIDKLAELQEGYIAGIGELLGAAREAGEVDFVGAPEDQARLLMVALQGARAVGLPGRREALFRDVVQQLRRSLGLAQSAPA